MQGLKGFLSAVLLCTAVHAIGDIISHEMYRNWNDESIWNDPAWQNFTATFNNGRASLFNSTFINSTSNNNVMTLDGDGGTFKDYYRSTLPRELISFAFISALMYFWDILLEYFLPTRPRGIGVGAETEKAIGLDIPWADKTLCRLIAKGRARKASISWGNTFLKWLIDIIFGTMWNSAASLVVRGFMSNRAKRLTISSFLIDITMIWVTRFIRLSYIVSLIAFITIPAPQRPLFRTSADALVSILCTSVSKVAFARILKSELGQKLMVEMTESLRASLEEKEKTRPSHLVDEL